MADDNDEFKDDSVFEEGDSAAMLDWDGVPEVVDTPVAGGEYDAQITKCEYTLSNASNQPMWKTELTITSDGEGINGRKLFENFSFSEKALPYTKKKLAQLDPVILSIKPFNLKTIPETLVGKEVRVRVRIKEETYEGEKRKRSVISRFLPKSSDFLES